MKSSNGFTLVEVIVTLVVVAIIIAVGIPGLSSMMANNQAIANSNDLITALSFSRSEAVKRGTRISICAKSSTAQGNFTCGSNRSDDENVSNDWSNGWIAFIDSSGDATEGYAPPSTNRLRSWQTPSGDFAMTGPVSVSFNSSGAIQEGPAVLRVAYSHCTGQQNRIITIAPTGHTSVTKAPCT